MVVEVRRSVRYLLVTRLYSLACLLIMLLYWKVLPAVHLHLTAVCLVHACQIEFEAKHVHLLAFSGFHRGCTLSTLLATPQKVGVTIRYVKYYFHWVPRRPSAPLGAPPSPLKKARN